MKTIESLKQLSEMIDDWANHKLCSGNFVTKWEIDVSQNMSGENKIYFIQKEIIEATDKFLKSGNIMYARSLGGSFALQLAIPREQIKFNGEFDDLSKSLAKIEAVRIAQEEADRKHLQKILNEPMTI